MNHSSQQKIYSAKPYEKEEDGALQNWLAALARPLVFTNGCFDILHRGHIAYLEHAASLGAALLVGINSDESVRLLGKGDDRPINPLPERMAVLAALACVDGVIAYAQETPLQLIKRVQPQHLVKGGDWKTEQIIGGEEVRANGGEVHSVAFEFPCSTTKLLAKIRASKK